ncbi:MAG: Hsp20/alpha crystallin family protein, partial [Saprospiraceae bacterium]|nr:Hsp20/alpha crystallin family protein [Saprospiraceae bacterium]
MNVIKVNPFAPSRTFGHLMDEIFNKSIADMVGSDYAITNPSVNIIEKENAFLLELAVPGLEKSDFNINVEKGQLIISAEKESKKIEENEKWTRKEFNYGKFSRSFTLGDQVNPEAITAEYQNGILTVSVAK